MGDHQRYIRVQQQILTQQHDGIPAPYMDIRIP